MEGEHSTKPTALLKAGGRALGVVGNKCTWLRCLQRRASRVLREADAPASTCLRSGMATNTVLLSSPWQGGNIERAAHQIQCRQVFISKPARWEMMDGETYVSVMKVSLQIFVNVQRGFSFLNKKCHPLA